MFALSHDYRIMREDRGFLSLPEIKLGMPIPPGVFAIVYKRVPKTFAKNLAYTSDFINSKTALKYGLVDQITSNDKLMETAKLAAPLF